MYLLINANIDVILRDYVKESPQDAPEYDWLFQNVHRCGDSEYQRRYRKHWAMNGARLSEVYCKAYFENLQTALCKPLQIRQLMMDLYAIPSHQNGRKSVQFSFATKLLHMADPRLPIYDSKVAWFYFFVEPSADHGLAKIDKLVEFYKFLTEEYGRILKDGLLAPSIAAFRNRFRTNMSDEKIIDALIWACVVSLNKRALMRREICYR